MKLVPVITEKATVEAQKGKYSFWVETGMNKNQIKELIAKSFNVHPITVVTSNRKAETRRTMYGKFVTKKARKKAIVTLKKGEKIAMFEVKEEKK